MGWNGSGTVTLLYDFTTDRDAGAPAHFISADKFDALFADLAGAIEDTINVNGENAAAANISWGGFKITSLGAATVATDAVRARQVAENAVQYGGTTGGSANAYTVTNSFITTVAAGTRLLCLANHTNNGASTLNLNGGGATAIVMRDGATALGGSEIVSGDLFEVIYDGASWCLQSAFTTLSLPTGGVINWASGGITITENTDALLFAGAANGYSFSTTLFPTADDGGALGKSGNAFSDLWLASGGSINFNNSDVVITHFSNEIDITGGLLRIVSTSGGATGIVLESEENGTTGSNFIFFHDSASPAANDQLGAVIFNGRDAAAAEQTYASITGYINNTTAGASIGGLLFYTTSADVVAEALRLVGAQCYFAGITTTASAANAFLDSGDLNRLYRSTSSLFYKQDVTDLDGTDLSTLAGLRPIKYRSKAADDDQSKWHFGLIAEEVAAVDPRLVHYGKHPGSDDIVPDGVQYERVIPLLIAKINELTARVAVLES